MGANEGAEGDGICGLLVSPHFYPSSCPSALTISLIYPPAAGCLVWDDVNAGTFRPGHACHPPDPAHDGRRPDCAALLLRDVSRSIAFVSKFNIAHLMKLCCTRLGLFFAPPSLLGAERRTDDVCIYRN